MELEKELSKEIFTRQVSQLNKDQLVEVIKNLYDLTENIRETYAFMLKSVSLNPQFSPECIQAYAKLIKAAIVFSPTGEVLIVTPNGIEFRFTLESFQKLLKEEMA